MLLDKPRRQPPGRVMNAATVQHLGLIHPSQLLPADRFLYDTHGADGVVTVEVLRPAEPHKEFFGRPDFIQLWCRRLDTNAEGYLIFGPDSIARQRVPGGTVFVRIGSHRARERMESSLVLGYSPRKYFSWDRSGEWAEIPADRVDAVLKVTGITLARKVDDIRPCLKL